MRDALAAKADEDDDSALISVVEHEWVFFCCRRVCVGRWGVGGGKCRSCRSFCTDLEAWHALLIVVQQCFVQQRNDDEAVVDKGGARSLQGTNFQKEDLEGKQGSESECFCFVFLSRGKAFYIPNHPLRCPCNRRIFIPRRLVHSWEVRAEWEANNCGWVLLMLQLLLLQKDYQNITDYINRFRFTGFPQFKF